MRKLKGFTLIELLVVIAIIGVMASLVIVNLSAANKKSRDSRRKADLSELRTALELYYEDNYGYPIQASEGDIANVAGAISPTYIKAMPTDPRNYPYLYQSDGDEYTVKAELENEDGQYTVYSAN